MFHIVLIYNDSHLTIQVATHSVNYISLIYINVPLANSIICRILYIVFIKINRNILRNVFSKNSFAGEGTVKTAVMFSGGEALDVRE